MASVVEGQASENHEAFKETCERLGYPSTMERGW